MFSRVPVGRRHHLRTRGTELGEFLQVRSNMTYQGPCAAFVTVTERGSGSSCRWCGNSIPQLGRTGRPREYCRSACRQRAYEARRWARAVGLADDQQVVHAERLAEYGDALYVLEAALEDVEADIDERSGREELREALTHLVSAAQGVVGAPVRPVTPRKLADGHVG